MERQEFIDHWKLILDVIQTRWPDVIQNDIVQSNGLVELASIISRKSGESGPNVQHELVYLFQHLAKDHPFLEEFFSQKPSPRDGQVNQH